MFEACTNLMLYAYSQLPCVWPGTVRVRCFSHIKDIPHIPACLKVLYYNYESQMEDGWENKAANCVNVRLREKLKDKVKNKRKSL